MPSVLHQYNEYIENLNRLGLIDENNYYTHTSDYWDNTCVDSSLLFPLINIYKDGMSLVDLGCGAGNIMFFSKLIGYKSTGIDYKSKYRHICRLHGDFQLSNIEDIEIKTLNSYDVIYSYRPLRVGFEEFINKVIDNMFEGQYLITPTYEIDSKVLKKVDEYTYIKINQKN